MMQNEPSDQKKTREPVFQNRIMLGQVLQMLPLLGLLGTVFWGIWTASAQYAEMNNALLTEKRERVAAETEMKVEFTASTNRLADKIDSSTAMEEQKLTALNDKVTDLKATMTDLVKASTPVRR